MWKDFFCTNVHTTAHCYSLFCLHTVSFPHPWFCNVLHWSFEKLLTHLNYKVLATINTFYYTLLKNHIGYFHYVFHQKNAWFIGKLSEAQWQSWVFQNYNFSLESLNFIFGNKHCQLIFLKRQAGAAHF